MSRLPRNRLAWGLVLGGLWERRWLSLVVFGVATISAAAASMGPTYADAARTVVLRDAFADASPRGRGIMVTFPAYSNPPRDFNRVLTRAGVTGALDPPVLGAELTSPIIGSGGDAIKLIWRAGACKRLRILSGGCSAAEGEVVASRTTSESMEWDIGERVLLEALIPPSARIGPFDRGELRSARRFQLTVVGIYEPRNPDEAYWLGLPYFPDTIGMSSRVAGARLVDPLFTAEPTVAWTRPARAPWRVNFSLFVDAQRLDGDDSIDLDAAVGAVRSALPRATVYTGMQTTTSRAIRDQAALGVPIALVILQLVGLSWLVFFFAASDLVRARRLEIGLARLRGLSRRQIWRFAIAEPAMLLVAGLPAGVLAGWLTAAALSRALLPSGIPVTTGRWSIMSAVGAVAGGLLAAALAARAIVRAPVTEQLVRSRTHPERRSWVPDAIVIALVGIGVLELTAVGIVAAPSRERVTALLVPGLMAAGVALLASRALPAVCRAVMGPARRAGLAVFLSLRQIARAPGTANSVIVLAASFGLATFAVSLWSVASDNHRYVAETHNGAATVFVVRPPKHSSLVQVVDRIDPEERSAAVAAVYDAGARFLAVDTSRIEQVAYWQPSFASQPLPTLLRRLRPPVAERVLISGDRIRVTVDAEGLRDEDLAIGVDLELPERTTPLTLTLRESGDSESNVRTAFLSQSCRQSCELRGFRIDSDATVTVGVDEAQVLIRRIEVHSSGRWRTIAAGLTDSRRWRAESGPEQIGPEAVGTTNGLEVSFEIGVETLAVVATHPAGLPAVTVGLIAPDPGAPQVVGLDGDEQSVTAVARANAAPGAPGPTALVDYTIAENAAFGVSPNVEHQVWVAPGAEKRIRSALQDQGVTVAGENTVEELVRGFNQQGPGLALVLLLASAASAAVLAMARAAFALYATRRRRTYELAALSVIGVTPRIQRMALLIEQAITLGVGVLAGVAAGIAAATVALPRIPQFSLNPSTPPLRYSPDAIVLGGIAVTVTIAVAIVTVITTEAIRRAVRVEQLREAPP